MKRLFTALMIGIGSMMVLSANADMYESLRQKLPALSDEARLDALTRIHQHSLDSDNLNYQLRCLNELIGELDRQHKSKLLATTLCERAVFFYNYDMTDSIFEYVPKDMAKMKDAKQWDKYYEIWSCLVNTYIFSGQYNIALREVQSMFDDAAAHENKYGMGIAYYAMGNVYSNMRNTDECVSSYRKGLDLLKRLSPQPSTIVEIYSYYGDVLNDMKQYEELDKLTHEWKDFLEQFIVANKLTQSSANIAWSYYYVACAQAALGLHQLTDAEHMLEEVHKRIPSENDYVGMTWLFYCAQLHLQRGQYQAALEMNNRRMQLMTQTGDDAMYLQIAGQRAEILRGLGRYEEALRVSQQMFHVQDSINATETKKQLNEMNTLFHVDELKMEQERAQFRNTLIIIGLIVLALVIFTIFRIRSARRMKKAHNELLIAYDQLEETTTAKERIESDLRIARNIQMGMVPSTFPIRDDLDLYASMTPAKEVGGDLYGYLLVEGSNGSHDKLYFALGDVSGKGVPASLFMAQATRLFRTMAAHGMMPAEIATRMNDALSGEDNETSMFVTMFVGLVDLATGHLDFANAGHNPPLLVRDGHATFIDMEANAPIGLWPGLEYTGEEIDDISNCLFFVYSDGLNEAENRQKEQFTDERLLEILTHSHFETSQETVEFLRNAVETHRDGAEPNDDLTMLCVKVKI